MNTAQTERLLFGVAWGMYLLLVITSGGLASFLASWQHGLVIAAAVALGLLMVGAAWGGGETPAVPHPPAYHHQPADHHQPPARAPTDHVLQTLIHCLPLFLITSLGVTSLGGQAFRVSSLGPDGFRAPTATADHDSHDFNLADVYADKAELPAEATLIGMIFAPTAADFASLPGVDLGGFDAGKKPAPSPVMLYRFQIVCCAADAVPLFVMLDGLDRTRFANDTWITVRGRLDRPQPPTNLGTLHVIDSQAIPAPAEPYLRRKL